MNLNIDAYFSPDGSAVNGAVSLKTLPPLLLPTRDNIDKLTNHISATMPQFLSQNNIPAAPSSISYDNEGQIQLPADYAYASEFKLALANDPTMSKKIRTVNALSSHFAGLQKSLAFQREYATATQTEANAIIAKFSNLFSDDQDNGTVVLQFSADGRMSITFA